MASPVLIKNRYEVKDVLGRGGMGVVYKAFDKLMRREVAVKTLRDASSSVFVDLFYRECSVLAAMVHPNIVEIFDMGEYDQDGALKPYFVMPLLPGRTLYDLIYPAGNPLPPERCADIVSQACRGLHAAHECGLLHRDIKPRNIFVMRDDAVKLIDFGVVRLLGNQAGAPSGNLGTLNYMAPEQIQMKPLTARSDIFSLATVCYEALTGSHPFVRQTETETAAAILDHMPALASTLNPLVSRPLSQAVAQAMAKDPRKRFESAAAFADALQRGLHNERPSPALLTNPQNRLARAQRSFARGDYEFTREIIEQLEADGLDVPEIAPLKAQLGEAVRKQQLEVDLATARRYCAKEEYALAMRRVADILQVDPANRAALSLKLEIENKLNEIRVADSLKAAEGHLESGAFGDARRLIEDSLRLQPDNAEGLRLLREADQKARDWPRQREEQEKLFQAAQSAYADGRFDTSLRSLEQLEKLSSQSKAAANRVAEYRDFHKRVRLDYDALEAMLADARKLLANGDLEAAFLLSEQLRELCPKHPDVVAIGKDLVARRNEREREYRRGIEQRIANEPDLNAQLHILTQAVRSRPNDDQFQAQRRQIQAKLQQVAELVDRAQGYEADGRFDYAVEEWLCLGDIYPAFPGLRDQLARVNGLWERAREKAKAELAAGVTEALRQGDQENAARLLETAQADFQDDADYRQLKAIVETTANTQRQVSLLLGRMQKAESEGRLTDIPPLAQSAASLSQDNEPLRQRAFGGLIASASRLTARNWHVAKQILHEAARLGPVPAELYEVIKQEEREEEISAALAVERESVTDLEAYRESIAAVQAKYPDEIRLEDRLRLLDAALADKRKQDEKLVCASELALLDQEMGDAKDHVRLWETWTRAKILAAPYAGDPQIELLLAAIGQQVKSFEEAAEALSRDRIQDCYAICDAMLARLPAHHLFQTLKDRAAVRHRELGDEYLARVERWLASGPDLYEREQILEKAHAEYPFETRYADELRQLRREKAMAELLAAKARAFEERGDMAQALAQWRQMESVVPSYPNLAARIAGCEAAIDRQQRKERAERMVSEGQSQLAAGQFAEGYRMVYEACELSHDIDEPLKAVAPDLLAAARAVPLAEAKLAGAMIALAQFVDNSLRVPKDLQARISEARKAEDLTECLTLIQERHGAADLKGALAIADEFLAEFPGVKQVESLRVHLLAEIEDERKQQARKEALAQLQTIESEAAGMTPPELLNLKKVVYQIASRNLGDDEVTQLAYRLDTFFSSLAEVRENLQAGRAREAEEAAARALHKFPGHALFSTAASEAARQKAELAVQFVAQTKQRLADESDFTKQAAILQEGLAKYPNERYLLDEFAAVNIKLRDLNEHIAKIRELEAKQLFGEAIKECEVLRKAYPWYSGVDAEVERLTNARRKEKQDALDRWSRQVEEAILVGDFETASAMIRQAQQQQPDRKLQGLEEKLNEALAKKKESDALLAEGRRLFTNGDLPAGSQALLRAHELQPRDKEKTQTICSLLLVQIRAAVSTDFSACEKLLADLNRLRPAQSLPPELREIIAIKRQAVEDAQAYTQKMLEQVARFAAQEERARSKRSLTSLSRKILDTGLLNSRDLEVRRAAGELSKKVNLRLSGFESTGKPDRPANASRLPSAGIAVGVLLALTLAAIAFFLSRPDQAGVPVQITVRPEHATIELDGQTCVAPDCKFLLKPGEYVIYVRKDGYKQRSVVLNVKPGDSTPLNVNAALEPLLVPTSTHSH